MDEAALSRSPKRKRADLVYEPHSLPRDKQYLNRTIFSFAPPSSSPLDDENTPIEDGSRSPRSKVAQKLQHLKLEDGTSAEPSSSGSGVIATTHQHDDELASSSSASNPLVAEKEEKSHRPEPSSSPPSSRVLTESLGYATAMFKFDGLQTEAKDDDMTDDDATAPRKRVRLPDTAESGGLAMGPNGEESSTATDPVKVDKFGHIFLEANVDPQVIKPPSTGGAGSLKKSYPSINRLSDSKSRNRKKLPMSSLSKEHQSSPAEKPPIDEEDLPTVVDPVRAALTWQEDEITIYDPEDKDDDGTGINGIGFKPSAAVAHQRAQKRRQQLAEYRKREESEARARRNQRRREQLGAPPMLERKHSVVRVHFSEAEPTTVIMT